MAYLEMDLFMNLGDPRPEFMGKKKFLNIPI